MTNIEELESRLSKLEAEVVILRTKETAKLKRVISKSEFANILSNPEAWPVCNHCGKRIEYDPSKHTSYAKWLRLQYCSRLCVTRSTYQKLQEKYPPKKCTKCGYIFARANSEKCKEYVKRVECYKCSPLDYGFHNKLHFPKRTNSKWGNLMQE